MRPHEPPRLWRWALPVLAVLALGACSRLTFVKPSMKRQGFEQVAPVVDVHETRAGNQRLNARNKRVLAQQQLARGDLDAAERETRQALKLEPDSADGYTLLGVIADRRGRAEDAGKAYRRAAELAPSSGATLNNYGAWLCSNGRAVEALGWFDRALADAAYPSPATALANAGICAGQAGQMARAERDLRAAIGLEPGSALALGALSEHAFGAGRYLEARAFSERRLAAAPADARALALASQIEQKLGDTVAADRYVRRMRAEFPDVGTVNPGESTQR
jgi:type IV pilus assembly protein PilF